MRNNQHHHAPHWQRQGGTWHFVAEGQKLAQTMHDFGRWLCYTADDIGDDGLLGQARTLAAAKAYLERHALYALNHDRPEEAPL